MNEEQLKNLKIQIESGLKEVSRVSKRALNELRDLENHKQKLVDKSDSLKKEIESGYNAVKDDDKKVADYVSKNLDAIVANGKYKSQIKDLDYSINKLESENSKEKYEKLVEKVNGRIYSELAKVEQQYRILFQGNDDKQKIIARVSYKNDANYYLEMIDKLYIFDTIVNLNKSVNALNEKLNEAQKNWEPKRNRLYELAVIIKNKKLAFEMGVDRSLDPTIDAEEKEFDELISLQNKQKEAREKIADEINKRQSIAGKLVSSLNNIVKSLNEFDNNYKSIKVTSDKLLDDAYDIPVETIPNNKEVKDDFYSDLDNSVDIPVEVIPDEKAVKEDDKSKSISDEAKPSSVSPADIPISKGPIREFITIALYKPSYDEIAELKVAKGTKVSELDKYIPKARFKEFEGWGIVPESVIGKGKILKPTDELTEQCELRAAFKFNRKKTIAVAAGVATAAVATIADMAITAEVGPTNGLVSQATAVVNGIFTGLTHRKIGKTKPVDIEKEKSVKGIKKAGVKLTNYFRNKENLTNLRNYFGTTAALSAASGIIQGIHGLVDKGPEPIQNVNTNIFETETPELREVKTFNGIDPNKPIYDHPGAKAERPLMQYFGDKGAKVHFFDSVGKEINYNTPVSEIANGPIRIVETQTNGSNVQMGYIEDFATRMTRR